MLNQQEYEDFIAHYGIKGMKWGVRRDNPSGKGGSKPKYAKPGTLSDRDLQNAVRRLNLEQQYVSLVAKKQERNKTPFQKGAKLTTDILASAGKEVAKNVVQKKMMDFVKKTGAA